MLSSKCVSLNTVSEQKPEFTNSAPFLIVRVNILVDFFAKILPVHRHRELSRQLIFSLIPCSNHFVARVKCS